MEKTNYSIIGEELKLHPITRIQLRRMLAQLKDKHINKVGGTDIEHCLTWLDNHYGITAENDNGTICYMSSDTYQKWEAQIQNEIRGGKNGK